MKWFNDLPEERIIELAMKKRKDVREDFKNTQKFISERSKVECSKRRKKLRKKQAVEKERLHLITSITDFETVIGLKVKIYQKQNKTQGF